MFTLFEFNATDLISVMNYAAELNVNRFSFDLGISIGNALNNDMKMIEEEMLQKYLLIYIEEKEKLRKKYPNVFFEEKCNLINHLRIGKGIFSRPPEDDLTIYDGCQIGFTSFVIDINGDLLGCRRLVDSNCGNLLDQSFESIWFNSSFLKNQRRKILNKEICNKCNSKNWCQGCEAYEKAMDIQRNTQNTRVCGKKLTLETYEDRFINNHIIFNSLNIIQSEAFKKNYLNILLHKNLQRELLTDYEKFSVDYSLELDLVRTLYWFFVQNIKK